MGVSQGFVRPPHNTHTPLCFPFPVSHALEKLGGKQHRPSFRQRHSDDNKPQSCIASSCLHPVLHGQSVASII